MRMLLKVLYFSPPRQHVLMFYQLKFDYPIEGCFRTPRRTLIHSSMVRVMAHLIICVLAVTT